ncbi:hypothetical protein G6O67_002250 [Ophiocordyceps sinensis]|uniref:Uncharacterized protein n=1 Tax=Ophiocordyceps sinensis TaxID=72228 RepID=A0A8H4PTV5_9HYPO|nr:hypothetical protein G6O67_002250 [Ophiocordyceps sinensis]
MFGVSIPHSSSLSLQKSRRHGSTRMHHGHARACFSQVTGGGILPPILWKGGSFVFARIVVDGVRIVSGKSSSSDSVHPV